MKTSRMWVAAALALAVGACDTGLGPDLTGLWVAQSYTYVSDTGTTVDIVDRDGASMTLTVGRLLDGTRPLSVSFSDGQGSSEALTGEADVDAGIFTIDGTVFQFQRTGEDLVLTSGSATFDFGQGAEDASLTIRLTRI